MLPYCRRSAICVCVHSFGVGVVGGLGVHRFYLGYIGIGLIQILVFVVTFGMGGIWGFIEGILCLTGSMRDVDGLPLRD